MPRNYDGGPRFYINFVDDETDNRMVYFIKHKTNGYEKFTEYHSTVNNISYRNIKY